MEPWFRGAEEALQWVVNRFEETRDEDGDPEEIHAQIRALLEKGRRRASSDFAHRFAGNAI